jgi:uncharacterized membrane protein
MHFSLLLVGHVVHVSFHSSFVSKAIPWEKTMVKFGLLELQVGLNHALDISAKKMKKSQHNSSNIS